jgi:hypothetical protein
MLNIDVIFSVEEVSGDVLFSRSLATTGTYTYSRKSSGLYLAVVEQAIIIGKKISRSEYAT